MHTPGSDGLRVKFTQALIAQFANAPGTHFMASLQFPDGVRLPAGLLIAGIIEATPNFEAIPKGCIFCYNRIKTPAGLSGKYDRLLDACCIHHAHPGGHCAGFVANIIVRMKINDREPGFGDFGDRCLIYRHRPEIF